MKSNISIFYYQTIDTFKKVINIFKFLEKQHLYKLILLLISMLVGAAFELLFLVYLSSFIKIVLNNGLINNLDSLSNDGINLFYLRLLNFFSNYTESNIISNCIVFILISLITLSIRLLTLRINYIETSKIGAFIERKCGESLIGIPYTFYKDLNISTLISDFNNIPKFAIDFFQTGIQSLSSLIIIICLTVYVHSRSDSFFIFAFFLLALIYLLTLLANIKKLKSISTKVKKFNKEKTSSVNFIVRMFRHILLEQKEIKTKKNFGSIVSVYYKTVANGMLISIYPKVIIEYAAIIAIAILLIMQTIIYGPTKSVESIGIFLVALLRILPSLQTIYISLVKINKNRYALESVYDLLNLPNKRIINDFPKTSLIKPKRINSIKLNNISFKYASREIDIIKNFSYEFIAGKSYAIVGGSGSGKSTLIDIIVNLLVPQKGDITLNKKLKLTNENFFQNIDLIRSNTLLLGQNDFYCGNRIKDFLEITLEDEKNQYFLNKLNEGIDYLQIKEIFEKNFIYSFIGENGSKISGGQRQRILLLKALLSKKSILIFDEALSSLDEVTKNYVLDFLLSPNILTNKRIMIFSTHSSKVANACDEIIRI